MPFLDTRFIRAVSGYKTIKILARNKYPASVVECTSKRFMEKTSRDEGSNEKGEYSRPTKILLKLSYVSRKSMITLCD